MEESEDKMSRLEHEAVQLVSTLYSADIVARKDFEDAQRALKTLQSNLGTSSLVHFILETAVPLSKKPAESVSHTS